MNAKVYWVGLGGGLLVTAALFYPLYLYLPGLFVSGWYESEARLAGLFAGLAVLLLLATGSGAARLCGLKGRRGAGVAGLLAGLIASLFAFVFIINPAAGVWGNRDLLLQGLKPFSDDIVYVASLMDATLSIILWAYLAFWASLLVGAVLGLLGGLAAGSGGKAGRHLDVLSVPMSIAGILSAVLVVVGSLSIFSLLAQITQRAADQVGHVLPYPGSWIGLFAAGTALIYLLIWQLLAWLALRKASSGATTRLLSWEISGWLNGLTPVLLVILILLLNRALMTNEPWVAAIGLCLSALIGFPALRIAWRMRTLPRPVARARIPARWFLVGSAILLSLVLVGFYFGGAGPSLSLVMLPIVMLPSLIPPEAAAVPPAPVAGGLMGILKAHYLAVLTPGWIYLLRVLIPILVLTAVVWLSDWYGPRLTSWLLSRIRRRSTPVSDET